MKPRREPEVKQFGERDPQSDSSEKSGRINSEKGI